ncbi:polyketide synthase [Corallococcus sicarius]|uniref:Phenolphthiocerol/phthiocerol polyketide synthase subunit E n=1 Tax=Corallococcus sicarius TaxID=2316726 RepID=A0A3A8NTC2_9BACT|nr:polyketide synthase [Corallococcus sicarius]RKH43262.1 amino acid adenylation domain-containing protein [Corallococcus sicarius]
MTPGVMFVIGAVEQTVVARFAEQAASTPEAEAVRFEGAGLTYAALDRRSNQLAHHLRGLGVSTDVLVGVCLERSVEMVVAVLAVLKAGGAYLPLDPAYPAPRLAFMLEDARAPVLLTQAKLRAGLPPFAGPVLCLDESPALFAPEAPASPVDASSLEGLAYAIYTSGSTGTPKGVAMGHGPLGNLITWQLGQSVAGPGTRTLQFSPLSFDVSFQELFGTWCSGGTLVLVRDAVRLDAVLLLQLLADERVERLFLPFIALQNLAEIATSHKKVPPSLREVVTAGEQLQVTHHLRAFFAALPGCALHNHYGPSETHVVSSYVLRGAPEAWPALPPIGKAVDGCELLVLDEQKQPLPQGESGELYLAGVCLAKGYLHREALTAERFVPHPLKPGTTARAYKTGDLARVLPDGNVEFLGRIDGQVKVRGYRIELGEIEVALGSHPAVKQVAVVAREDVPGDKRLVAYIVPDGTLEHAAGALRRHLQTRVPDYMVPSAFVVLAALPRTPSGKIDRRALPAPLPTRPELQQAFVAPRSPLEQTLADAWAQLLRIDRVGIHDSFFELGGNSLLALQCVARLRQAQGLELPIVQLFQSPTVAQLAAVLSGDASRPSLKDQVQARQAKRQQTAGGTGGSEPVAIIGMAGRFPGAPDVETFWKNLVGGVESVTTFTRDEVDPSVAAGERDAPEYVRARGILEGVELFDAGFFGIMPKEAQVMDPQQRLFLETAWSALESAGCVPETYPGLIGVFAGTHNNSYQPLHVQPRQDIVGKVGAFQAMVANEKDYVATRVAHKLDLRGPALSLNTACSTSLVAVAQAFWALQTHQCDVALAGGAAVTVPQKSGHLYQEGGMLSQDGHCRPFDASATGTLFSDGVGAVVLKRLSDAQADGDVIHAVLRGVAVNNDGAAKMSFAAPGVEGQATVIALAHANAGVDPRTIRYVEAHGTATPLGDPIEVEALSQAFRAHTADTGFCAIGSVKSNFGHLTAAAGVAGLLKTVLALKHRELPPTLHFQKPNPKIDFERSPFFVQAKRSPWPASTEPLRAGVSSFGVGGTNAHVVVEEAPARPGSGPSKPRNVLLLSAKTPAALTQAAKQLAAHLQANPEQPLADVAHTLATGRRAFPFRRAVVAGSTEEAVKALTAAEPDATALESTPPVAFLFPGQGSQHPDMAHGLYRHAPAFRATVDACAEVLKPLLGRDLREVLFPKHPESPEAAEALRQTSFAQAALFTVEYALAQLWWSWGVRPGALVGHSVGEFVAACLAGVFTLEDALHLVAKRGLLMQAQAPGSMLSVRLSAEALAPRLTDGLAIASDNGPRLCVVSGPTEAVARLQTTLEAEGTACRLLQTSHAFHSPMMDAAVAPFLETMKGIRLSEPRIPIVSTATGTWLKPSEATSPEYWARHLRDTVRFAPALRTLWEKGDFLTLEVGPRVTLATLARQQATAEQRARVFTSLGESSGDAADWSALLNAVGQLWRRGVPLDWSAFHADEQRQRVTLPTYPFQRQRHWIELERASVPVTPPATGVAVSTAPVPRAERLVPTLRNLFEELSGLELADADAGASFLELGLDSLVLTQAALAVQKQFGVKVTFRQLLEEVASLGQLAAYLDGRMPPEAAPAAAPAPAPVSAAPSAPAQLAANILAQQHVAAPALGAPVFQAAPSAPAGTLQAVIEQQLRLMTQQLSLLSGQPAAAQAPVAALAPVAVAPAAPVVAPVASTPAPVAAPAAAAADEPELKGPVKYDVKKAFGAIARISLAPKDALTPRQQTFLEDFTRRYNAKTQGSKRSAQENRSQLSDPRVVTGFRPLLKELIYPLVVNRSKGSQLWDVDGNQYLDALNGFGSVMFGHAPDFITQAVHRQVDDGYELGPMHPLAGEVAKLVCEFTGADRAALCNTGSEAVMGALRIARTVTGRSTVAIFAGSYHGIFDEVLVRGTKSLRTVPAAPGIMAGAVQDVLVLDYGTPESLEILRSRADSLAAIMVEPVQSRRPDFQPREFLHQLRDLTQKSGSVYIFDEVITGFRMHPGGAQAVFGVQADLGTYGKVVGGGMPIGVIAGKRPFMDALDGGHWQFGDDSVPTVGVTYFAGTFVRHPLALAAAKAALEHMKAAGPELQRSVSAKADQLASTLNAFFDDVGAPLRIKHFGSLWKTFVTADISHGDLLFCLLRDKGIHIWDGFPCFFTTAHTEADLQRLITAFQDSVTELQDAGFLPGTARQTQAPAPVALDSNQPPVPGARLGRDPQGNPAWFVPHPTVPGKFVKLSETR